MVSKTIFQIQVAQVGVQPEVVHPGEMQQVAVIPNHLFLLEVSLLILLQEILVLTHETNKLGLVIALVLLLDLLLLPVILPYLHTQQILTIRNLLDLITMIILKILRLRREIHQLQHPLKTPLDFLDTLHKNQFKRIILLPDILELIPPLIQVLLHILILP